MRGRSKKKKTAINKDIHAEGLCFVCKDGGELRICDFRNCLKAYHHGCVGEKVSFLESQNKWNCAWHRCFRCRRSSHLYCYMCTNALCLRCLTAADILRVKGAYGFCKPCLKLALLFEENREYDSNGVRVDFSDCNTFEGLFKEYYVVVKNKEGFESADLNAVKESVVRSLSEDSEEEQISEYDEFEDQKSKRRKTSKRPRGRKPTKRTHVTPRRSEDSEDEEEEQISKYDKFEDQKSEHGKTRKRPRGKPPTKKTPVRPDIKEFVRCSASGSFPSIVVENVKLVFLKRSVLNEMLKKPELFEEKVTGCIVRVKSDSYESRKSHQLVQVKGAKTVSTDENTTETVLLLSTMPPTEIRICLISDEDFSEEEFDDFRQKVEAGEIERPTVEVLQQKAISLHKDMTNARIRKELELLKNEWTRGRSEYLEKRKKLQSPKERARLLENVPTVIPESNSLCEPAVLRDEPQDEKESALDENITEHGVDTSHMGERVLVSEMSTSVEPQQGHKPDPEAKRLEANELAADSNPESTSLCQPVPSDEPHAEKESEENTEQHGVDASDHDMGERLLPTSETSIEPQPEREVKKVIEVIDVSSDDEEDQVWCMRSSDGERSKFRLRVLRSWCKNSPYVPSFMVWKENGREEDAITLPEAVRARSLS